MMTKLSNTDIISTANHPIKFALLMEVPRHKKSKNNACPSYSNNWFLPYQIIRWHLMQLNHRLHLNFNCNCHPDITNKSYREYVEIIIEGINTTMFIKWTTIIFEAETHESNYLGNDNITTICKVKNDQNSSSFMERNQIFVHKEVGSCLQNNMIGMLFGERGFIFRCEKITTTTPKSSFSKCNQCS